MNVSHITVVRIVMFHGDLCVVSLYDRQEALKELPTICTLRQRGIVVRFDIIIYLGV